MRPLHCIKALRAGVTILLLVMLAGTAAGQKTTDPLPSSNNGPTKFAPTTVAAPIFRDVFRDIATFMAYW